jgi:hypothetical protein
MKQFNREYRNFKPSNATGNGPPTQRICKKDKCKDETTKNNTPPVNG